MKPTPRAGPVASDSAAGSQLRPEHLYKGIGLLLLVALFYRFFDHVARVFLIVYAAAILAVALNAIVSRVPAKRSWVTGLTGLVLVGALAAALWWGGQALVGQTRGLVTDWPLFEAELRGWGERIQRQTGIDVAVVTEEASSWAQGYFSDLDGGAIVGRASGLVQVLALPLLILFGGLFALGKPNSGLLVPLLTAVPGERRPAFRRVLDLLGDRILGWVKGQIVSMTAVGVLATAAFYLIGVPYALLLGVAYGLAEFVPILGPWVGGIPAVILAFLDEPTKGLYALVAMLAIQQVESNLITPFAMSKVADVHPFITLFAILFFGGLFGFLGILLALPLVLLIWTLVQVLWVERAIHAGGDRVAPVVEE